MNTVPLRFLPFTVDISDITHDQRFTKENITSWANTSFNHPPNLALLWLIVITQPVVLEL